MDAIRYGALLRWTIVVVLWALAAVAAIAAQGVGLAATAETPRKVGEAATSNPHGQVAQEALELLSEALAAARNIEDAYHRAMALGAIARARAEAANGS